MLVDNIGPGSRGSAVPSFEQHRMINVLRAMRLEHAMSPIEVIKANGQGYTHTLHRGRHRLAASIAVGYPLVPTVIRGRHDKIKQTEAAA